MRENQKKPELPLENRKGFEYNFHSDGAVAQNFHAAAPAFCKHKGEI